MNPPFHPLSWLYPWGSSFHRSLYRSNLLKTCRLPVPVVCVGNITSGGSGKTPVVVRVVKDFLQWGKRPAIITRGYKRLFNTPSPLTLLKNSEPWEKAGDEAALLSRLLPETPVIVSPDRVLAGEEAVKKEGINCLVMDDGFQHWRLERDLDIVCLDASQPFGGGLKTYGSFLRERPRALRRAGIILLTKTNLVSPEILSSLHACLPQWAPGVPVVESIYRASLLAPEGSLSLDTLEGQAVLALSGISSPHSFEEILRRLGASRVEPMRFPDHYPFSKEDIQKAASRAKQKGLLVVTTEKDAVRMTSPPLFHVLRTELEISQGWDTWKRILSQNVQHELATSL